MLTSITPLGERGRGQRWWLTVAFFAAASTAAGAATGGALGAAGGWLEGAVGAGARVQLAALALVALVALVVDLSGRRVPGPRRQVNENWLPAFRGWVYGAGFGLQLGIGAATIVTTALVYVAFAG